MESPGLTETQIHVEKTPSPSLEECETRLKALGLTEPQIQGLGDTIDVIGDTLLDAYFKEFYDWD